MAQFRLRTMKAADRWEVADLICISMNRHFRLLGRADRFQDGPAAADVYFEVYQTLDPGCGIVAEHATTGRLMGSCFYHPRETHVTLGIMNVHPNYSGFGAARALLQHIIDFADRNGKPLRVVSSAMNVDSFSLYTRAGLVPHRAYQDMCLKVPESGFDDKDVAAVEVRDATVADIAAIESLEMELSGIRRGRDFRHILENHEGYWHLSACESRVGGGLDGFMASCGHSGCNLIGPGVARNEEQAAALMLAEMNRHRGRRLVFLLPVDCPTLVHRAYQWGARNCEMHFSSVRGPSRPSRGVNVPTFMPETA